MLIDVPAKILVIVFVFFVILMLLFIVALKVYLDTKGTKPKMPSKDDRAI